VQELEAVQQRRSFPTHATQSLQIAVQNKVIRKVLQSAKPFKLPLAIRLLRAWPVLRRLPARVVGMGFRPEHVKTPDIQIA
jgi:hypothetical protein